MPEAQVGEKELEEIVKIGVAGEAARGLVGGDEGDASGRLLGEYEDLGKARMARTPRVEAERQFYFPYIFHCHNSNELTRSCFSPVEDTVMAEARNLRNMIQAQTPLLGDENTPLHTPMGTGFEGATPRHAVSFTPNPLATPFRPGADSIAGTPRGAASTVAGTPMRTPFRDNLSINVADGSQTPMSMMGGETEAQMRRRMRAALARGFEGLPAAQNSFEVEMPEDEETDEVAVEEKEEDAAERDAREKRLEEEERERESKRRSLALQKGLPRPVNVDVGRLLEELSLANEGEAEQVEAQKLVDREFANLVKHESILYPLPGSTSASGTISDYQIPMDEDIASARSLIHTELATSLGLPGGSTSHLNTMITSFVASSLNTPSNPSWSSSRSSLAYSTASSSWVDPSTLSSSSRIAGIEAQLALVRTEMASEASKASKTEKKLAKQLGGYAAINSKARARLESSSEAFIQAGRELKGFERLREMEVGGSGARVRVAEEEVERLERRERELQARYGELERVRRELKGRVEEMEDAEMIANAEAALVSRSRHIKNEEIN